MARLFPLLVLLLGTIKVSSAQMQMSLLQSAVGGIVDAATGQVHGTGFVTRGANGKAVVLTCFHVAHENGYKFAMAAPSSQTYLLTLQYTVPAEDVAVFSPDQNIDTPGLIFAAKKPLTIGEYLIYVGYKTETRDFMVSAAPVDATGTGQTIGGIAGFLEFYGQAKPGYSGGPVMTGKGEVVGILSQAWAQQGYQAGAPIMNMNKAVLLNDVRAKLFPVEHQASPLKKEP